MADVGFNFQQCLLFSKFHNLKISLFPKHPCMHRSKIIDIRVSNEIEYIITRDDVVSQRLKFGSAFLSSSWESKIALFF